MEFHLIIKKLNNTLSEGEEIIFDKWYHESMVHRDYFSKVENNFNKDEVPVNVENGWKLLEERIKPVSVLKRVYFKYSFAASLILFAFLAYMYQNDVTITSQTVETQSQQLRISSDEAILTLEDGTSVALEKGHQYNSNYSESNGEDLIYKPASANETGILSYNYLTIPRGRQFFITLSDGTKIWLNSESQLKYPVQFISGETRTVELVYGEAYFDVTPSRNHNGAKFKVVHNSQDVEVIGTQFNIKAYKDDSSVFTTLVEGKIVIKINQKSNVLLPNDQLDLNKDTQTSSIKEVDVYNEISWKEGVFSFERKPLKEIMKVLSRWYDIDIVFENKALEEINFFGAIGKDQSIEDILDRIKNFNIIESYEIKTDVIILK